MLVAPERLRIDVGTVGFGAAGFTKRAVERPNLRPGALTQHLHRGRNYDDGRFFWSA